MYSFIRKRSQGGFHAYGLTNVKIMESGDVVEVRNETFKKNLFRDVFVLFFVLIIHEFFNSFLDLSFICGHIGHTNF